MYRSFEKACKQLADIEAIDYYLARQVCDVLGEAENALLFHSVLGASYFLREGHSCLDCCKMEKALFWCDIADNKSGFRFPANSQWQQAFSMLPIAPTDQAPVVFAQGKLYLRRYWAFEVQLGADISALLKQTSNLDLPSAQQCLQVIFAQPKDADGMVDYQRIAVANALTKRFSIITGGPGTGKTYTVARLLVALQWLAKGTLKIALAAPTGKAAQRLSESIQGAVHSMRENEKIPEGVLDSIPQTASTLHRLLGVIPNSVNFRHNKENPLPFDVLLVDEVSMVDLPLMARLFRAVSTSIRVILLGDADQLPSVAAGSVLNELAPRVHPGYATQTAAQLLTLTGDAVTTADVPIDYLTVLGKIHRSRKAISDLAGYVIQGDANNSWSCLNAGGTELMRLPNSQNEDFDAWLKNLAEQYYRPVLMATTPEEAFIALEKFRLLAATRVGTHGVDALNSMIQNHLQGYGKTDLYHGRPIMVTENDYEVNLFNGDVGLLWQSEAGRLRAVFPNAEGGYRWITPGRLPRVETVYAMTIHKTQGSEFATLAIVMPEQDYQSLSRELLYTGITRAKNKILLWTDETIWKRAVVRHQQRYSGLRERI